MKLKPFEQQYSYWQQQSIRSTRLLFKLFGDIIWTCPRMAQAHGLESHESAEAFLNKYNIEWYTDQGGDVHAPMLVRWFEGVYLDLTSDNSGCYSVMTDLATYIVKQLYPDVAD